MLSLMFSGRTGGVIIEGKLHDRLRFSVTDPFSGAQKVFLRVYLLSDI